MTKTYEQLLEEAKAVAVEVRKAYDMDTVMDILRQFAVKKITALDMNQLPEFIASCEEHLRDKADDVDPEAPITVHGAGIKHYMPGEEIKVIHKNPYDNTADQVESLSRKTQMPPAIAAPYGKPGLQVNRTIETREDAIAAVKELQEKWDLIDDNAILRDLMEKMEERHGEEFNAFFEATISAIMEAMNLDELRVSTAAVIYNAAITSGLVCSEEPGALVYRRVTPADVIDPNEKVIIKGADVVIPDECAASGQSCEYAADGPNGEMQCKYCGKEPDGE
ncbi:hypothetical protein SLP22_0063 [Salmonella phage BAU.Micro_SLP-22]|nr:hypothetical protein SLP22_00015 [Salmonella phage BAU.Micro_SLP-22]